MTTRDVHRVSHELDETTIQNLITRMEVRGKDPTFTRLRDAYRVTRQTGIIAILDGDYASLTFACSDPGLGKAMEEALRTTVFTNPRVMLHLPRLLGEVGLELAGTLPNAHAEIGTANYFKSFAETYAPLVSRTGLLSAEQVDTWRAEQRRTMEDGTFLRRATTTQSSPDPP